MKKVKVYTSFVFYIIEENGKTYCNFKNPLRKREDFIFYFIGNCSETVTLDFLTFDKESKIL